MANINRTRDKIEYVNMTFLQTMRRKVIVCKKKRNIHVSKVNRRTQVYLQKCRTCDKYNFCNHVFHSTRLNF